MASTNNSIARTVSLDVLRFMAVLLVFGAHLLPSPPALNGLLYQATFFWKRGGYIGVDIFFVLSGFLVSGLLFREYQKYGRVNVGRFLLRRAFKLYPSLWLLIVVSSYIYAPVQWYQMVGELFFLQNYVGYMWLHTWSLAVEEHFYLLLSAFTLYWQAHTPPAARLFRYIPITFLLITIFSFCLRLATGLTYPDYSRAIHVFPTHLRLDGLMLGTFIGYQWHFRGLAQQSWWRHYRYGLLLSGGLLFLPAFLLPQSTPWIYIIGNNLFSIGSAALLLGILAFDLHHSPLARFIGRLGSYSYSIYLWHLPIEIITRTIMEPRGWLAGAGWYTYFVIYLVGSILWGIALYWVVELPFMRLRDRWFPSQVTILPQRAES